MKRDKTYIINEIKKFNSTHRRLQEKSKTELQNIYDSLICENYTQDQINEKRIQILQDEKEEEDKYNNNEFDNLTDDSAEYIEQIEQPIKEIEDIKQHIAKPIKKNTEQYKKKYQSEIKMMIIQFKKNIKHLLKQYEKEDYINDNDHNDIIDIYNEEYDIVDIKYNTYENDLKECNMTFDKSFINFYKKTMTNVVNEVEHFFD